MYSIYNYKRKITHWIFFVFPRSTITSTTFPDFTRFLHIDHFTELKPYCYIYERPLLYQALMAIESAGPQGVNRSQLTKMMGIDYYDGRSMCKNLVKSGNVVDVNSK
jgi:hypothetical protein